MLPITPLPSPYSIPSTVRRTCEILSPEKLEMVAVNTAVVSTSLPLSADKLSFGFAKAGTVIVADAVEVAAPYPVPSPVLFFVFTHFLI